MKIICQKKYIHLPNGEIRESCPAIPIEGAKSIITDPQIIREMDMETSEKPKIFFTVATVHVPRYGELIASEKRALPRLQKELNEANQLKMESHRTMMSRHRKRK